MNVVNRIAPDITVLADALEVPGIGFLPVNAFVLHAREPVVVDTGLSLPGRRFLEAVGSVIDPVDVEWIWLTHPDRDHTGGLFDLLEAAPRARVVSTFVGVGILSTERPLPMDRIHLLNPGQTLDVGDRRLTAFRPPLFDSPATIGLFDDVSGAYLSSDCFGAPMPSADLATSPDVRHVAADELQTAQLLWASVDSPWVHTVDQAKYLATVAPLRSLDPAWILSSHLPPATHGTRDFSSMLTAAPSAPAFIGPDQNALEQLLASFEPTAAART